MNSAPKGWDPALEVGHPLIDGQHQTLYAMIVELDQRMARQEFGKAVLDALHSMVDYAATHFQDEERLMEEAGWPGLTAHRGMHAEFMQNTAVFRADALRDSEWTSLDVLRFLLNWLVKHIKVQDRGFFEWMKGQ